jgi:protein disulfide-isomerase A6
MVLFAQCWQGVAVKEQVSSAAASLQVMELTSEAAFKQHCKGDGPHDAKQLCFVVFLPSILDSKAAGRNAYIKTMQGIAEKYKGRPYSYFWAEGSAQPKLEANVGVGGFGYPALVAISPTRSVYASVL